ncbi:MAG: hypothetical protein ACTMIR_15850 [Cellulomonadaceae bacterium]
MSRAPRRPREPWAVLGVVALVGVLAWYAGFEPWQAVVVAVAAVTVLLAWAAAPEWTPAVWARAEQKRPDGVRDDIDQLAWSLGASGSTVHESAVRSLRILAARRLARAGLDLADPADTDRIAELIGPTALATMQLGSGRTPTLRQVSECLDALEAVPANPHDHPSRRFA